MESKFYTQFDLPPAVSLECKDASLTRQEFLQEADLNNIMQKYAAGFPLPSGNTRTPMFGDFSDVPDYQTALQIVIDAQDKFDSLPSAVRKRFGNDPAQLLDFLRDEQNRDEARKLGLLEPVKKTVESTSVDNVSVPSEEGAS